MDHSASHGVGSMQITENDTVSHASSIFNRVSQELSLVDGSQTMYRPIDRSNEGPFEFKIEPQGSRYVNLAGTELFMQLRVVQGDGTPFAADAQIAFINLPGNSIFKSIDIEIGGQPYGELGNNYSNYKAYFETVLSYSQNSATGHLAASQFFMDTARQFDSVNPVNNIGYASRRVACQGSRPFQVQGPVHCDILQSDRYLPPGVSLTIKFNRATDAFTLICDGAAAALRPRIIIQDIKLYMRHVTVAGSIMADHLRLFEKGSAIFPINRTQLKTVAYPLGLTNLHVPNLFTGTLPKTILITLIPSASFNGTYQTNPYHFQHFGLTFATLMINDRQVPSDPYRPDFAERLFTREYREFFNNIGIHKEDLGCMMTPTLYAHGMFMLAFDLSPDQCNGFHMHAKNMGTINLDMTFANATQVPINVLAFATYDNYVTLDSQNRITTDIGGAA
jgi:hypothetical protein